MVHICDKRYSLRAGENTQIRVYTNQERVTLFVNGEEMAVNEVKRHVASFPISLSEGKNAILVKAGDVWDAVTIERVEKEPESYVFPEEMCIRDRSKRIGPKMKCPILFFRL